MSIRITRTSDADETVLRIDGQLRAENVAALAAERAGVEGPLALELLLRLGLGDARLLCLYAIPFGVGIGGNAVSMPILVGRCFGELHFSKIMGLLMSSFAAGILVGIPGAGAIFDRTGSYEWVLILSACGLALALVLCLLIAPDRYREDFAGAEQGAA